MQNNTGLIYNIQRFSLYDGPGIRTVVFFQGCNLQCSWCHNPESAPMNRHLMFQPEKCIGCGECFKRCSQNAHIIDEKGVHVLDRELCINNFDCVDTCYAEALTIVGREVDVDFVTRAILTDRPYYEKSDGGVTFSGGECMLQIDFLREILVACKERGIHTAIDTAGNVPWSAFEQILDVAELFLYDMKAVDNELHKKLTRAPNKTILTNLRKLSETGKRIHIRIPYVPGANDGEIDKIADVISPLGVEAVYILPYHQMGLSKETSVHADFTSAKYRVPDVNEIENALAILASRNINALQMNTGYL